MVFSPWDWLGMFWDIIAVHWKIRLVEFNITTMPHGFNSKSLPVDENAEKVFFRVSQSGTADGEFNMACSILDGEGNVIIICDSQTPSCTIDYLSIG